MAHVTLDCLVTQDQAIVDPIASFNDGLYEIYNNPLTHIENFLNGYIYNGKEYVVSKSLRNLIYNWYQGLKKDEEEICRKMPSVNNDAFLERVNRLLICNDSLLIDINKCMNEIVVDATNSIKYTPNLDSRIQMLNRFKIALNKLIPLINAAVAI